MEGDMPNKWIYDKRNQAILKPIGKDEDGDECFSVVCSDTSSFIGSDRHSNLALIGKTPEMYDVIKDNSWAHGMYNFILKEFAADPDTGEAVSKDVRPFFNELCEFIARCENLKDEISEV